MPVVGSPIIYRKIVRDALLGFFAQNFNDTLASFAGPAGYNLPEAPPLIDFGADSTNFAVAHIGPENIENCQIQWEPGMYLGGCLYTSEALDEGNPRGFRFSGKIMANLDFYWRQRQGVEGFNTEDWFDAIEDAAQSIIAAPSNQWPAGVIPSRQTEFGRGELVPLGDGLYSRVPIKSLFEIRVR